MNKTSDKSNLCLIMAITDEEVAEQVEGIKSAYPDEDH